MMPISRYTYVYFRTVLYKFILKLLWELVSNEAVAVDNLLALLFITILPVTSTELLQCISYFIPRKFTRF